LPAANALSAFRAISGRLCLWRRDDGAEEDALYLPWRRRGEDNAVKRRIFPEGIIGRKPKTDGRPLEGRNV